jgi:hypothetical protein
MYLGRSLSYALRNLGQIYVEGLIPVMTVRVGTNDDRIHRKLLALEGWHGLGCLLVGVDLVSGMNHHWYLRHVRE